MRSEPKCAGQPLDLAQEVGGGEPALAELAGQRVGGGGERDAGLAQPAEQGGHQHGVAGVVQLELVDAQQGVRDSVCDRLRGSRARRRGWSARRRCRTASGPGRRATARRAGGSCRRRSRRRGRPRPAPAGRPADGTGPCASAAGTPLRRTPRSRSTACCLGRLRRVGPVGVEADVGEPRRRHELGDQPVLGHRGVAFGEGDGHRATLDAPGG